ncbi:transmembrane 6 superfamily member 2b [Osmerus eperlanus]|uniref:transmembrane 6 superfamily member 2b n=1 Tax=Osmerus eperlanus TaxID=29151 RepID=UPI002E0F3C5A
MEVFVFLFSLTALGVLYTMNNVPELQEPYVILQVGAAVLVFVFLVYLLMAWRNPPKDLLFFAFAVFSFTCVIDLVSALQHDGWITGFMEFYQKAGEPYLGTAYGIMMCYWDGIVHFILYLFMICRITERKDYRIMGLFWAGSLLANMSIFVTGIVVGKHGSDIRPAFWLNIPFLLVPVWGAISVFTSAKSKQLTGGYNAMFVQCMRLIWRPQDLMLVLLALAAMAFTIFRGLVALDAPLEACTIYLKQYEPYLKDPVGYPRVMMLHFLFYGVPLLGALVYGLVEPGCNWMPDLSVFFAGAMAQCQFAHMGGSLHSRTMAPYRIPGDAFLVVMAANLVYVAIPQIIAMRCTENPNFFLTVSSFPGQTGLPYSKEKDTLITNKIKSS